MIHRYFPLFAARAAFSVRTPRPLSHHLLDRWSSASRSRIARSTASSGPRSPGVRSVGRDLHIVGPEPFHRFFCVASVGELDLKIQGSGVSTRVLAYGSALHGPMGSQWTVCGPVARRDDVMGSDLRVRAASDPRTPTHSCRGTTSSRRRTTSKPGPHKAC